MPGSSTRGEREELEGKGGGTFLSSLALWVPLAGMQAGYRVRHMFWGGVRTAYILWSCSYDGVLGNRKLSAGLQGFLFSFERSPARCGVPPVWSSVHGAKVPPLAALARLASRPAGESLRRIPRGVPKEFYNKAPFQRKRKSGGPRADGWMGAGRTAHTRHHTGLGGGVCASRRPPLGRLKLPISFRSLSPILAATFMPPSRKRIEKNRLDTRADWRVLVLSQQKK